MKQKIILPLCILAAGAAGAQFQKGDRLPGGSFSASVFNLGSGGSNYRLQSNAGIQPSYAWLVKDNLSLGVRGNISFSSNRDRSDINSNRSHGIGIGPGIFLAKFRKIRDKFGVSFTHDLGAGYNRAVSRNNGIKSVTESINAQYSFSPGVYYMFTGNFMGMGSLGGVYAAWQRGTNYHNLGLGVSFLQNFNLGIAYRFSKKQ